MYIHKLFFFLNYIRFSYSYGNFVLYRKFSILVYYRFLIIWFVKIEDQ